jgi:hypothetical protein
MRTVTTKTAKLVLIAGIALLAFLATGSYTLADQDTPQAKPLAVGKDQQAQYQQAIRKMEKHIVVEDGLLVLKIKSAAELNIDRPIFNEMVAALESTNRQIQAGTIKVEDVQLTTAFAADNLDDHHAHEGHSHP